MAARRLVTLTSGGSSWEVYFSCAALRHLDPTGTMDLGAILGSFRTPAGLTRALAAGLWGATLKRWPDHPAPLSDADILAFTRNAETALDAVGFQPAADAVTEAYLAWFNPEATYGAPEGDGAPKA